jgi:ectoine hydroxylase-related dioxygenase (phytanoyl-CoA dioxygenase family)
MLDDKTLSEHTARVRRNGYTVVERAIEPELVDALVAALECLEESLHVRPAGNPFEGSRTIRIYNLLAYDAPFVHIPVHENVLPVVESVLDPGCLVSSLSSISICPGEVAQPMHADDQLIPIPRPHPPLVCNTMWALTDFTEENGATRIVPGSHRRDQAPIFGQSYESVSAVMRKGSVMVYDGSLWHGGGENRTDARRVGVAMNYCAGYIRQQENQQLGIPRDVVRGFPRRLQELVGYGIYNGLIGHIDKKAPLSLIGADDDCKLIWGN